MRSIWKCVLAGLALALLAAGLLPPAAKAQFDPGSRIYLYENGVRVGVQVHPRTGCSTPNTAIPAPLSWECSTSPRAPWSAPYSSQADFFQNVPFAAGSKYIRVTAQEYTSLPVTR